MKKLIIIPLFLFSFIFAACTTDDDDAIITCNTYDDWLYYCDSYCTMSVACEDNYLSLPVGDKVYLDECADGAIYEAAYSDPAICTPDDTLWTAELSACVGYGEDLLGMVCDYPAYCGDGVCDGDEDATNCPEDCGPVCGDGFCEGDEDAWTCIEDCGEDAAYDVCFNYEIWVEDYACEDTTDSYDCTVPDENTPPSCETLIYNEFDLAATADDVDLLLLCAEELALTDDTCIDYEYDTDLYCSDLFIDLVGVICTEPAKKKK